jgi:hypothetical protein
VEEEKHMTMKLVQMSAVAKVANAANPKVMLLKVTLPSKN